MKGFLLSKINWLAIVTMLVGLQDFIGNWDFSKMTVKGWITFALGLVIMLVRTYGTSTSISGALTPKS